MSDELPGLWHADFRCRECGKVIDHHAVDESCHNRDRRWLATVDALTSRLDAATRRADEVGALLREARALLMGGLHYYVVSDVGLDANMRIVRDRMLKKIEEIAALIDAAKEGR